MDRLRHVRDFYRLLDELESRLGGKRTLAECSGHLTWPRRGIYYFFEPGEVRCDSGQGARVVRIGTHALSTGSKSTFWQRLSQHRGQSRSGGGNHRGSIFRLLVGTALQHRREIAKVASWGLKPDTGAAALHLGLDRVEIRASEHVAECAVSRYIGEMPFLWIDIGDAPSPESDRAVLERNSIALLSNFSKKPELDPPSPGWLGKQCDRERVRRSGLWNNNHVDETYDPAFLETLQRYVRNTNQIQATYVLA
ncbi:MAG TPA: hypothetical protein VMF67_07430 [Rhizomicrobium sp.]|nr:hypothetical protein [Rhizomicrobium sp.]